MPRKPKAKPVDLPAIPAELLEQFGSGPMTADAINAATLALKKALIERALGGEMSHHLGYPPGAAKPSTVSNQRNGTGAKTVLTEDGPIRIEVPRDRDGSFEPLLIPKHERRFADTRESIKGLVILGCAFEVTSCYIHIVKRRRFRFRQAESCTENERKEIPGKRAIRC
nr:MULTISPECIES: transposase [unclassified Burkholderia]